MPQGSITLNAPRAEPRVRAEKRLLVVGDERVRNLAESAYRRPGWTVKAGVPGNLIPHGEWKGVVVDAPALAWLRTNHPELLRRAQQIWVVPPEGSEDGTTSNPFENPLPVAGRLVKRALDIVLAFTALVAVLPVLLLAMAVVRFDSPGPALFGQVRMGLNGRRFRLYKIRTMRVGSDDAPHRAYQKQVIQGVASPRSGMFKLVDDERVTRVGRFLRRFSIDELPQLWNVLKGEMSIVGPRPPLPWEVELYSISAWERLRVRPGLTGLWQVSGRSLNTFDAMVALDVRYCRDWSLALDLAILLSTPRAVLSGSGAA